ncbi:hypothetical protein LOK49_LG08G01100 [Camellia lanceoleosa]|uniref:Uncharacterized protein n=1 Tax=Camellia lanceoleosa TaxID=1840588 RepID=A0ACC0GNZ2_9ERIC|nr:hypothetical protein LOK49_LG08G01100 [Camellia lanceoleosa]
MLKPKRQIVDGERQIVDVETERHLVKLAKADQDCSTHHRRCRKRTELAKTKHRPGDKEEDEHANVEKEDMVRKDDEEIKERDIVDTGIEEKEGSNKEESESVVKELGCDLGNTIVRCDSMEEGSDQNVVNPVDVDVGLLLVRGLLLAFSRLHPGFVANFGRMFSAVGLLLRGNFGMRFLIKFGAAVELIELVYGVAGFLGYY